MAVLIYTFIIAASAASNRLAGGGWPVNALDATPGRFAFGRFQTATHLGLVALIVHPWQIALAFALGFLFWRLFGWGHLITLGRTSGATARPATGVDKILLESLGPHWGLFVRMLFVLPMLIAVAWFTGNPATPLLAIPFAALAVGAYEFWWRIKTDPIGPAELSVGVLWGVLIVLA
jgi:hypothetical protein